ncbi:LysR family transcriptional regulator [Trinickia violacea]|uniref:LysR family transcriptional regulator n=1 Tax=Trinickia violacea TaxID=2571746 RepID=A0A4P8J0L7_9BURK|nr:LysR family transcriptional regulator [Trinickia violacea]QCP53875.1 LysR family transcriptional regulator [Trinickia violacea]
MDHLQAMRVFARVAQLGSFTKAAEQMQLPRPSVSNAIHYLEEHLRVRLLQRTTRRVSLTHEGSAYYARCVQVLADIDDAESLFSDATAGPRGAVRVDLPERLALHTVIPALPEFFAKYPDIRVVLSASDRIIDLIEDGVDCAVRVGVLSDTTLVARRIGMFEQINCASPAYIEQYGMPSTPDDLPLPVSVVFPHGRYLAPRVRIFVDWVAQLIEETHSGM